MYQVREVDYLLKRCYNVDNEVIMHVIIQQTNKIIVVLQNDK